MNILVTPVLVVVIGLFVRSRLIAALLHLVIEAILFTFQTLTVLVVTFCNRVRAKSAAIAVS